MLCASLGARAQAGGQSAAEPPGAGAAAAVERVELRQAAFDTAAISELKAVPDHDYDRYVYEQELLWDRFKRWLGYQLRKLFGSRTGQAIMDHLHYVILALAVLVVLMLLRKRLFSPVLVPAPHAARQVRELTVDPTSLDLDALLEQAEKQEDWRGALRLHYLKMLRHLVDQGHVRWQPENTDEDYLRQLDDAEERSRFRELSFLFRWAWFGGLPVDADRYRDWAPAFIRFHSPPRTARS